MKAFGAIDVGCTFDVGRIGLNVEDAARGGRGPELVFTFGDGATFAAGNRDRRAHDRFLRRPAVCEYAPGDATKPQRGGPALLMVANGPGYLFRLWPLFLLSLIHI